MLYFDVCWVLPSWTDQLQSLPHMSPHNYQNPVSVFPPSIKWNNVVGLQALKTCRISELVGIVSTNYSNNTYSIDKQGTGRLSLLPSKGELVYRHINVPSKDSDLNIKEVRHSLRWKMMRSMNICKKWPTSLSYGESDTYNFISDDTQIQFQHFLQTLTILSKGILGNQNLSYIT